MTRILMILATAIVPLSAQADPSYLDDRSSPSAVVESLYNAINSQQYLRAYSYFDPDRIGDYDSFKAGYAETQSVTLRLGEPLTEGAAGTIYTQIPAVIEAVGTDGSTQVYAGCYLISAVSPGIQDVPPFLPIRIVSGTLAKTDRPFEAATGSCPDY
ncbi:hypothetical protein [Pseudooceanicola spongiae]|uniref:Uncharacterized protein n=1 Tax=Pseudooceanicola spongiae TaxID=2613965 RepID=A0A7L9WRF7_9RHOB|nr:hypothetical protein [Pseudooceanicola spongiae]QOL82493.1 hypothetical protein F3W81_17705 [Pseudooceanicola spongiae]